MDDGFGRRDDPHMNFGRLQPDKVTPQQPEQPLRQVDRSEEPRSWMINALDSIGKIPWHMFVIGTVAVILILIFAFSGPIFRTQWEYLVVSPGRVSYGSSFDALPARKTGNNNVTMSYAGTTTGRLDTLGRQGWELVSVTGAIGGDQQFILKRRR